MMVKRVKCWLQEKSKLTQENTKAFSLLVTSVWRHWENIMLASRIMIVLSIISQFIFFVTFKAFFVVVSKQRNKINELKTLFSQCWFLFVSKSIVSSGKKTEFLSSSLISLLGCASDRKTNSDRKPCFFYRNEKYQSWPLPRRYYTKNIKSN